MRHVLVNDTDLEYHERGSGSTVVLVHGAPGDYRTWLPHVEGLARRHRAVTYSQRYFGSVPWPADGPAFGVAQHAADLIALLSTVEAGAAHVVAWSYGGHVALVAAAARPEAFASLLVYEPGVPSYVEDPGALERYYEDAQRMFGPVFATMKSGDEAAAVEALLDGSGDRRGYFASQPHERRRIQIENARILPRLLGQAPPPNLSAADLATLRPPTCIAWGERTRPLFAIVSEAAARAIGGDAHVRIPHATHMWPEESPEDFVTLIERWLARVG